MEDTADWAKEMLAGYKKLAEKYKRRLGFEPRNKRDQRCFAAAPLRPLGYLREVCERRPRDYSLCCLRAATEWLENL